VSQVRSCSRLSMPFARMGVRCAGAMNLGMAVRLRLIMLVPVEGLLRGGICETGDM
jgi:hypothetical protein